MSLQVLRAPLTRGVRRSDILDLDVYESRRGELRPELMRAKRARQVLVGDHLNFMFESQETVRYQIQEVLRVEVVTDELRIQREIETYNLLLGAAGDLGCTTLVELGADWQARHAIDALSGLSESFYVRLPGGRRIHATPAVEPPCERPSLVQFLVFDVRSVAPIAVGCSHPLLRAELNLTLEQRRTLDRDMTFGA